MMKEIKAFIRPNKVNDIVHHLKDAGDSPLLLPEVPDEKDRCVHKLMERLQGEEGLKKVHSRYRPEVREKYQKVAELNKVKDNSM